MDELLRTTAERAIRYLRELPERSVAPDVDALIGLERFDEPLPDAPGRPRARDRAARRGRLAGHDGHGRPAVLRLRHRRLAAGGRGRELAGHGVGPERRRVHGLARRRHARAGRAALAGRAVRPAAHDGRRLRDRRDDGEPHRARRGASRRAARGPAGTSTSDGLFGRAAGDGRSSATRCTRRCSRRSACSASGGTRASGCRWTGRAACAPTRCRAISRPDDRLRCRPAT